MFSENLLVNRDIRRKLSDTTGIPPLVTSGGVMRELPGASALFLERNGLSRRILLSWHLVKVRAISSFCDPKYCAPNSYYRLRPTCYFSGTPRRLLSNCRKADDRWIYLRQIPLSHRNPGKRLSVTDMANLDISSGLHTGGLFSRATSDIRCDTVVSLQT